MTDFLLYADWRNLVRSELVFDCSFTGIIVTLPNWVSSQPHHNHRTTSGAGTHNHNKQHSSPKNNNQHSHHNNNQHSQHNDDQQSHNNNQHSHIDQHSHHNKQHSHNDQHSHHNNNQHSDSGSSTGGVPLTLHFSDPSCSSVDNGTHLVLRANYDQCRFSREIRNYRRTFINYVSIGVSQLSNTTLVLNK